MNSPDKKAGKHKDINALEADVAYFGARIAFAQRGEQTAYKKAQRKACEALCRSLNEQLRRLRGDREDQSDPSGREPV